LCRRPGFDQRRHRISSKIARIGGVIALEFNEEPAIGFYTSEVRKYFESKFARIFRGRVIISRGNLRSQPAPATSRVVAIGSVL
jgi:hypothetical protein